MEFSRRVWVSLSLRALLQIELVLLLLLLQLLLGRQPSLLLSLLAALPLHAPILEPDFNLRKELGGLGGLFVLSIVRLFWGRN